jgi:hypothetical protein
MEPYLDVCHHVYQDNYYNSVEIAEKLLLRKTRVCRTIRANRRIPKSLADSTKKGTFFYASGRVRGRFARLVQHVLAPLERSPTNLEKG